MSTDVAASAEEISGNLTGCGWVPGGLSTGSGMAALSDSMRPIDALSAAGLNWLIPKVQPLQDVLDRMTGNASVVQTFADAWQRASQTVAQVQQQLARRAPAATSAWEGDTADRYRRRAGELAENLQAATTTFSALGTAATAMGELVAGARTQVNKQITDLVKALISYARQAVAAEGGVTSNVMAQATSLIGSYVKPIADIEAKLRQTSSALDPLLTGDGTGGGDTAASQGATGRGVQLALLETKPPTVSPPGTAPGSPTRPSTPPEIPELPPREVPPPLRRIWRRSLIGIILWILEDFDRRTKEITPVPDAPIKHPSRPQVSPPPPGAPPAEPVQPGTPPVQHPEAPPQPPAPGTPPQTAPPPGTPPDATSPNTSPQSTPTTLGEDPPPKDAPKTEPEPKAEPKPEPLPAEAPADAQKQAEAKPGGIDESARPFSKEERAIAQRLIDQGLAKRVESLPELSGQRNADALVDGVRTEFKTAMDKDMEIATSDWVVDRLNEVRETSTREGQAREAVLDGTQKSLVPAEAWRGVTRLGRNTDGFDKITVFGEGWHWTWRPGMTPDNLHETVVME